MTTAPFSRSEEWHFFRRLYERYGIVISPTKLERMRRKIEDREVWQVATHLGGLVR